MQEWYFKPSINVSVKDLDEIDFKTDFDYINHRSGITQVRIGFHVILVPVKVSSSCPLLFLPPLPQACSLGRYTFLNIYF